jgi:hypothetical protein
MRRRRTQIEIDSIIVSELLAGRPEYLLPSERYLADRLMFHRILRWMEEGSLNRTVMKPRNGWRENTKAETTISRNQTH